MPATFEKKYGKDIKALSQHPNQYAMIYTMTGDAAYDSTGYPVTGIAEPIVAIIQLNHIKFIWGYNRATGRLQGFRADDKVASAGDGRLVEIGAVDCQAEIIDFLVIVDHNA